MPEFKTYDKGDEWKHECQHLIVIKGDSISTDKELIKAGKAIRDEYEGERGDKHVWYFQLDAEDADVVIEVRCVRTNLKHEHNARIINITKQINADLIKKDVEYWWLLINNKRIKTVKRCCYKKVEFDVPTKSALIINNIGNELIITGTTYPYKEQIKDLAKRLKLRYKWDDSWKGWVIEGSVVAVKDYETNFRAMTNAVKEI